MFIHLSVDGCLGCFYILAMMNGAAMKFCVQAVMEQRGLQFSWGVYLGVELLVTVLSSMST